VHARGVKQRFLGKGVGNEIIDGLHEYGVVGYQ
jgi:hypothetical protein